MANEIISEKKGHALIVTFNRPDHRNALNFDMATQLFLILKNATADRAIRVVVLRGSGGDFMDGLDLQVYARDINAGIERVNQMQQPYNSAIRELQVMEKPVLAVVEGIVAGPGLSFMLASDLVLAARSTKFNCDFTSYAMTPDGAASYFLTRKAGPAKANQLMMLNETFSAEEAEKMNLISSVVNDDVLEAAMDAWVKRLSNAATRAIGATKVLVGKALEQGLNQQIGLEHTYWGNVSRSFDFQEAIKAMNAKRDPNYTGA